MYQIVYHSPVYHGRVTAREIRRGWALNAELVTLSACETARGRYVGGEGFVGFTQALLMSGAEASASQCGGWTMRRPRVLMRPVLPKSSGLRAGLSKSLSRAEALAEARAWLRGLPPDEAGALTRSEPRVSPASGAVPAATGFVHPCYWAAFILAGGSTRALIRIA